MEKDQLLLAISSMNSEINDLNRLLNEINSRLIEAENIVKVLNFQISEVDLKNVNIIKLEKWQLN